MGGLSLKWSWISPSPGWPIGGYEQTEMSFDLSRQTRTGYCKETSYLTLASGWVRDDKCGAHGHLTSADIRETMARRPGDSHTPGITHVTHHTPVHRPSKLRKDPKKWLGLRCLSKNESWKLHRLDEYSSFNVVGENCHWQDLFHGIEEKIKREI